MFILFRLFIPLRPIETCSGKELVRWYDGAMFVSLTDPLAIALLCLVTIAGWFVLDDIDVEVLDDCGTPGMDTCPNCGCPLEMFEFEVELDEMLEEFGKFLLC